MMRLNKIHYIFDYLNEIFVYICVEIVTHIYILSVSIHIIYVNLINGSYVMCTICSLSAKIKLTEEKIQQYKKII